MSAAQQARCIFLDRDGVINCGKNVNHPEDFHLLPGVADAIAKAKENGWLVAVVSNQGGLGEALDGGIAWEKHPLSRESLVAIHAEMLKQLGEAAALNAIKFCPHAPSEGCECRKPKPGMLHAVAKELGVDLSRSFMIGDRASDVESGHNTGCTSILVLSGPDSHEQKSLVPAETLILPSLVEAIDWILADTH